MTVKGGANAELLLDSNLPEAPGDLDGTGVSDSSEGEIKRVTWQTQTPRKPEQEVVDSSTKSRLRVVACEWENPKGVDVLLGSSAPAEKKLQVQDAGEKEELRAKSNVPILLTRSPTRCTSFVGPMSPRSPARLAGELVDLQERNRFLEAALKKKTLESEAMKREFEDERTDLLDKIECLELANEQLLAGGENSGMEQLQMELTRLQKHNTVLAQRERELQFQLSTKDMLQKEVQHLQELNEQLLDTRLPADTETESGSKMLERIVTLETELAEAMEVNNLYKSQLHTAFAEQQNVQATAAAAALPPEAVEITKLRDQNKALEMELQELRDRFFVMSIRLAEREAQHEEAKMKVKRLQTPLRHFGGSFKW